MMDPDEPEHRFEVTVTGADEQAAEDWIRQLVDGATDPGIHPGRRAQVGERYAHVYWGWA